GPVTVGRLQERGIRNLRQLRKPLTVEVPGLGPKRMGDLQNAIRSLLRDAASRFEAGACPQAQELARRREAQARELQPRLPAAAEQFRVLRGVLDRFRPIIEIAEGVTLTRFYRKEPSPGLTPELLNTPIEKLVPAPPPLEPARPQVAVPPLPPPMVPVVP